MADKTFKLEVVAPDRTFYEGDVTMVELTTTEGDVGIYAEHIPMTMIVAPGVLTITEPSGKKKASLISGFMEIKQDKVTILAETVEWPDEIDLDRAKEAYKRAKSRLDGHKDGVNIARAEAALKRALTRQEAAGR
ncbi:MAG: ATP synthase F1 subunit epsilon [Lachnospiraceae bacterium]|nr:ATP synthase F1 subunit epsilon [Lachnospiraceae bacterium]